MTDLGANIGLPGAVGLAMAHPGHELRLSRWVCDARPVTYVLTAGSRDGDDTARVTASLGLARRLGAQPGAVFGRCLDREVYGWVLAGDVAPFRALADELADDFVARGLAAVVTDAWQLYNVAHDLWHMTVRAAAAQAGARLGRPVEVLDFPVVPQALAARDPGPVRWAQTLSDAEVAEKLRLAAEYPDIAVDMDAVLHAGGRDFVALESLHAPRPVAELLPRRGERPPYEAYGEVRVAAGLYGQVLRWRHAEPIALALAEAVGGVEAAA